MVKLAYTQHSKCCEGNLVWVQLPPSAQKIRSIQGGFSLKIKDYFSILIALPLIRASAIFWWADARMRAKVLCEVFIFCAA